MAMTVDYHVLVYGKAKIAAYQADVTAFSALFPDVDSAAITRWFNEFATLDINWTVAYPNDTPDRPLVWITAQEEPLEELLGRGGQYDGAEYTRHRITQHTVVLTITGPDPQMTRIVSAVIKAGLCSKQADTYFMGAGYHPLIYEGGGVLTPDESSFPDLLGTWIWEQTWKSVYTERWTDTVDLPDTLLVAHEDVIVNGNAGGVTPDQEL